MNKDTTNKIKNDYEQFEKIISQKQNGESLILDDKVYVLLNTIKLEPEYDSITFILLDDENNAHALIKDNGNVDIITFHLDENFMDKNIKPLNIYEIGHLLPFVKERCLRDKDFMKRGGDDFMIKLAINDITLFSHQEYEELIMKGKEVEQLASNPSYFPSNHTMIEFLREQAPETYEKMNEVWSIYVDILMNPKEEDTPKKLDYEEVAKIKEEHGVAYVYKLANLSMNLFSPECYEDLIMAGSRMNAEKLSSNPAYFPSNLTMVEFLKDKAPKTYTDRGEVWTLHADIVQNPHKSKKPSK